MIEIFPEREIFLSLLGFDIRWYGLLYVLAFASAWYLAPRLAKYRGLALTREDWLEIFTWAIGGVLIGGRLGYVFLYEPGYFLANPGEILAIWDGGMASHGGMAGVALALWLVSRRLRVDFLKLLDVLVVPAALGLALGRVGNFINQELFSPPAAAFYAVGKNLLVAGVSYAVLRLTPSNSPRQSGGHALSGGRTTAAFLISYSALRFLVEYVRIQEWPLLFGVTRGQLYCLPLFLLGLWLWRRSVKRKMQNEK